MPVPLLFETTPITGAPGCAGCWLCDEVPPVCADYAAILARQGVKLGKMERFAFYDRSKAAFAVVASGESRLYGCLILKKGVIRPA